MKPIQKSLLFLSVIFVSCQPAVRSNFGLYRWKAQTLDGQMIDFSSLNTRALVLNFYSPTCGPCVDEIPALKEFYTTVQKKGGTMYLVLERKPDANGLTLPTSASDQSVFEATRDRMKQDLLKYGISIPVVIMDRQFDIRQDGSTLISGTPETLFIRTKPLILEYNFIGPISTAKNLTDLTRDTRYQFALKKLDELVQENASAYQE